MVPPRFDVALVPEAPQVLCRSHVGCGSGSVQRSGPARTRPVDVAQGRAEPAVVEPVDPAGGRMLDVGDGRSAPGGPQGVVLEDGGADALVLLQALIVSMSALSYLNCDRSWLRLVRS